MKPMAWHKHYHERALNGMKNLPVDLRGVYYTLLDLMYEHMCPLAESDQMMAARMCCSVRKWKTYRDQLVALGKIKFTDDGKLSNDRFEYELKSLRKRSENKSRAGRASAEARRNSKENNETPQQVLEQESNRVLECQSARVLGDANASLVDTAEPYRLVPEEITPVDEAVKYYISTADRLKAENGGQKVWPVPKLPMATTRRKAVAARLKENDLLTWQEVVDKAASAPHLIGQNERNWTADLDWIAKRENFDRIFEGRYDSKKRVAPVEAKKPHTLQDWERWCKRWAWLGEWGCPDSPAPNEPDCKAPSNLIDWAIKNRSAA